MTAKPGSLLITNIGLLCTPRGDTPAGGAAQGDIASLERAALWIEAGVIRAVTANGSLPDAPGGAPVLDAGGCLATPGLIDAHTHLCFGGWRHHELALRLEGADYMRLHRAGGGIADTMRRTRAMTREQLAARALGFLDDMLRLGVTTCEIKSGYGLDRENELKQLRAIDDLRAAHCMDIAATFLGAHSVPPEFAGRADAYIDYLIADVLPVVARERLAAFCDVFCEAGVFDARQSRRLLLSARALGLSPKIHADELTAIGGAELAGELRAISAEHLIATTGAGLDALARGGVIACLLPQTSLYLDKPYARARDMIARGIPVAVCTDFNPGSCPSFNMQLCITLACLKYRMTPEEALCAVTRNAACAIGMGGKIGAIEPGKQGDIALWACDSLSMLGYRMGANQIARVVKKGEIVV